MTVGPRILLVSSVAPGLASVGRLFLHDLCAGRPAGTLECVHLEPENAGRKSTELLAGVPMHWIKGPGEYGRAKNGIPPLRGERAVRELWLDTVMAERMGRELKARVDQFRPDLLWVVLETRNSVRLAAWAARKLDVPIVTTTWDPPRYVQWFYQYGLDRFGARRHVAEFDIVQRRAVRLGVASGGMKEDYEARYRKESIVLIHGFESQVARRTIAGAERSRDRPFQVVVAGTVRPRAEWLSFLKALSLLRWKLQGRPVVVRVLGPFLPPTGDLPVRIEFLGWRDPEEALRLAAEGDLAYLPLWLDPAWAEACREVFPNKASLYVAARLPIFVHAPEASSIARFVGRFGIGACCPTNEPEAVAGMLAEVAGDCPGGRYGDESFEAAFGEETSKAVFLRRFECLIAGAAVAAQ